MLSDGSCLFVPRQALAALGLSGAALPLQLSEEALGRLERQAAALAARDKALRLLQGSAHSEASLRLKLGTRGFDREAVNQAVSWLADRGLLDDRRFAESWLLARLARHPEGRAALLAGLRRRGVGREVAEEALQRTVDAEAEREAAQRLLASLRRRGPALGPEELSRRLSARGFSRRVVRSVLEEGQ